MLHDATKERDESHAGKVVERSWYARSKHIFPASRWEVYDPDKDYGAYVSRAWCNCNQAPCSHLENLCTNRKSEVHKLSHLVRNPNGIHCIHLLIFLSNAGAQLLYDICLPVVALILKLIDLLRGVSPLCTLFVQTIN